MNPTRVNGARLSPGIARTPLELVRGDGMTADVARDRGQPVRAATRVRDATRVASAGSARASR